MRAFKVKRGTHLEGGKMYLQGDIVYSDKDLCTMFREKFEDQGPVTPSSPASPPRTASAPSLGTDKTPEFPSAEEGGYKVFHEGHGKYWVTADNDPTKALNEQSLKKKDVEAFIESLEDEDESEEDAEEEEDEE